MASEARRGPTYFGTSDEVRLGDRIRSRTLLILKTEGVVCYLPGVSQRHRDLEYEGCRFLGIQLPNGEIRKLLWPAGESSLDKRVTLLERGQPYEPLSPDVQLDETNQEWGKTGPSGGSS
jgi:hypothetical protein